VPIDLQILFVDDNSPDGTGDEVKRAMQEHKFIHLLQRSGKLGIGSAYRDGFASAISQFGPAALIQMDADLQHPPEKVQDLAKAVMAGADLAIASRYVPGGGTEGWRWSRRIVSRGANWLARAVLLLGVHDVTTGFRAFSIKCATDLLASGITSSGFAYQVEVVKMARDKRLTVIEVPFVFVPRVRGKSKLSNSEIAGYLKTILRLRFKSFG
jgi:dolichol-phosphate mannosyltransferase